jgi:hypothetical protein
MPNIAIRAEVVTFYRRGWVSQPSLLYTLASEDARTAIFFGFYISLLE